MEKQVKSSNDIEKKIDAERRKVKKIERLQDDMLKLNKQVNRCIEILSSSMYGIDVNNTLSEVYDENRFTYKKVSEAFDLELEKTKNEIRNLHKEKETIIENIKQKYTISSKKSEKSTENNEKSEKN